MREQSITEGVKPKDRFLWSIAAYAAVFAVIVSALIMYSEDWDLLSFAYSLVVVPALGLCIAATAIIYAFQRRTRAATSLVVALIAYCLLSWLFLENSAELRSRVLWALHSREYKTEVLARPRELNNHLKHIDWYGWGFAGSDTYVYLAYDPANTLSHRDPSTGRFGVLHCDVWKVNRLEDHWYSVTFFTNTGWDAGCDGDVAGP